MYDPKLAHATEVKAQVRLKFRNVNKQPMIVTRSLQLTQKKTKTEMKTLESLLVMKDPISGEVALLLLQGLANFSQQPMCRARYGNAESFGRLSRHFGQCYILPSRRGELVHFFGLLTPIRPLAEPSVLKKKFDDIFSATKFVSSAFTDLSTRYSKALNELKDIRKEMQQGLKLEIQKLEFLASDVDKANKVQPTLLLLTSRSKFRFRISRINYRIILAMFLRSKVALQNYLYSLTM